MKITLEDAIAFMPCLMAIIGVLMSISATLYLFIDKPIVGGLFWIASAIFLLSSRIK